MHHGEISTGAVQTTGLLPLVSVCIPVYNQQAYIVETIESVLRQTYTNLELVIVDDCSTDGSREIIRSFGDSRIRFFSNESNLGAVENWNRALSHAQGEFVKLLCGDDILYPDCISEQVAVLTDPALADVVLVTADTNIIDRHGSLIMVRRFPGQRGHWNGIRAVRRSIRFGTSIIGEPSAWLFRTGVLSHNSVFINAEPFYVIDLNFLTKIMLRGDLYVLDRVLYGFRVSPSSLSAEIGLSQIVHFCRLIGMLYQDRRFGMTAADCIIGSLMALLRGLGRKLIYTIY